MFLKILLIVIILLSLLFLSFSFKLVFNKKKQISDSSQKISTAILDNNNDQDDIIPDKKQV
jgi:Flp pilus assembly protein TadG